MVGIAVLAAGKGKRMNSTDFPKVLVPLLGKPLLGYVLDSAFKIKPYKIYIIVGFRKEKVIDFVTQNFRNESIEFVVQSDQLGTGHAILQLEPYIDSKVDNLMILSGDVPLISSQSLLNFIEFHYDGGFDLSLISTVVDNPRGYGRIVRDEQGNILKIVEEKDLSPDLTLVNEINSGIYIVNTRYLFDYLKQLKNENAQQEYYLTDIVQLYIADGRKVGAFKIENSIEVLGVNTYDELQNLEIVLNKRKKMVKGINHIGIAVSNLEQSMKLFQTLFNVERFHIEIVENQKVRIASFEVGNVLIELTEPMDEESTIFKFIQKRGEGIHHIAFEVENLPSELERLKTAGIQLVNEKPVNGAHDMEIAFIHPKSTKGVLIEFCQKKEDYV